MQNLVALSHEVCAYVGNKILGTLGPQPQMGWALPSPWKHAPYVVTVPNLIALRQTIWASVGVLQNLETLGPAPSDGAK